MNLIKLRDIEFILNTATYSAYAIRLSEFSFLHQRSLHLELGPEGPSV
jgi:hypothetical protein